MISIFKGRAAIALIAVFVAGLVAGVGLGYSTGRRAAFRPPDQKSMTARALERLTHELRLDAEQVAKVRPVVEETNAEICSAHGDTLGRVCELMRRCNRKIEPILREEQRLLLKKFESKREATFRKFARPEPGHRDNRENR